MENEVPQRTETAIIGETDLESLLEGAQRTHVGTPYGLPSLISVSDVVGITCIPEATLARELEMCYATLCFVSKMATGISKRLASRRVVESSKSVSPEIHKILVQAVPYLPKTRHRSCGSPIEEWRTGEMKKC